jgi:hypothetical protein
MLKPITQSEKIAEKNKQGSSAPLRLGKWCLYITIYFSINHRSIGMKKMMMMI